tara:strand:- start:1463 stop:1933 length:471 start_codon:yes stop_codon:yes gene_type:complete
MRNPRSDAPPFIRVARPDEKEALEALQRRSSLNNPGDRDALLEHPDAIDLPLQQLIDGCVLVAEVRGDAAGFAAVLRRDDGEMELDGLFVEPDLWRCGIGRALVGRSSVLARQAGAKTLTVLGNRHAEAFYLSCGFTATGIEKTRFGEGLRMDLVL